MKYCTSCGEKSGHKICRSCGIKENKEHKYCGWCGAPLNENAALCTNCGIKVKPNIVTSVIGTIIGIVLLFLDALFIYCLVAIEPTRYDYNFLILTSILTTIAAILCFPFVGRFIIRLFVKNKLLRRLVGILRVAAIALLLFFGMASFIRSFSGPSWVTSDDATKAAVVVFHENVHLKNEDSFVLNGSKVYSDDEPYEGYDNLRLVNVVLDYSAQNGFGGNNRKTYTVTMYFNTATNHYYRIDGTQID